MMPAFAPMLQIASQFTTIPCYHTTQESPILFNSPFTLHIKTSQGRIGMEPHSKDANTHSFFELVYVSVNILKPEYNRCAESIFFL